VAGSEIDICNLALGHLRQGSIASFDERSPAGKQCRTFYRQAIDTATRAMDWPFARAFVPGVLVGGASSPGYRFGYVYPAGCLAVREIARADRLSDPTPYEISRFGGDRVIFTNATAPVFRCTVLVEDVTDYDVQFVEAASFLLAMHLAMPLTGKVSLTDAMRKLAAEAVAKAQADAANEDTNDIGEDPVPDWLAVRGVQSLTRAQRSIGWGERRYGDLPAVHYLPNESGAPAPAMLGPAPSQLEAAYIPGLTAPKEPAFPVLASSDFSVTVDGGREGLQSQSDENTGRPDNYDITLKRTLTVTVDGGREGSA